MADGFDNAIFCGENMFFYGMEKIPVFVISLAAAQERRGVMRARMAAAGLDFEFFDAVDGRGFDVPNHPAYDAWRRRAFFGRDMTGGEIGCLLSHRGVYEKMVREGISRALIFEDDVILKDDFTAVLQALINSNIPFDVVRFLDKPKLSKVASKVICKLSGHYELAKFCAIPGGTYAYLITLDGAKKMISVLQRNYMPVDAAMGHVWLNALKSYIVWPTVASWDEGQGSYIGEARFDKNLRSVRPWYYPLSRPLFKVYEGVMKRILFYAK